MSSFPFVTTSNIFNTADYNVLDEGWTRTTADKLYLSIGGGTISGLTTFLAGANINGALNCTQLNTNLTSSGLSWQSIAGTSTIALNHTLNGTALLGSITNSAFGFLTNNIERARILNNGNFGIGTSSASYKLDVAGDINSNTTLRVNRSTDGRTFDSTNGSSNKTNRRRHKSRCYKSVNV